jgi:predicted PurR-regulated permease PerM
MEGNFLMGVGFVAFVVGLATVILLWASPITRYALAKGFLTFTFAYVLYSVYRQSFPHRKQR